MLGCSPDIANHPDRTTEIPLPLILCCTTARVHTWSIRNCIRSGCCPMEIARVVVVDRHLRQELCELIRVCGRLQPSSSANHRCSVYRNGAMVCRSWCLPIKLLLMDAQQYLSGAMIIIVSSWPSTDRTDSSVEGGRAPDCDYDSATKPWIGWVKCLGGHYHWIQKLIRSCVFVGMCSLLRMTVVAFERGYRILTWTWNPLPSPPPRNVFR